MDLVDALGPPKVTVYFHLKTVEDSGYLTDCDYGYHRTLRFL
jgi:DNA-binding IclR family transcriptional regulator